MTYEKKKNGVGVDFYKMIKSVIDFENYRPFIRSVRLELKSHEL